MDKALVSSQQSGVVLKGRVNLNPSLFVCALVLPSSTKSVKIATKRIHFWTLETTHFSHDQSSRWTMDPGGDMEGFAVLVHTSDGSRANTMMDSTLTHEEEG